MKALSPSPRLGALALAVSVAGLVAGLAAACEKSSSDAAPGAAPAARAPADLVLVATVPSVDSALATAVDYTNRAVPGAGAAMTTSIEGWLKPAVGFDRSAPLTFFMAQSAGKEPAFGAVVPVKDGKAFVAAAPPYVTVQLRGNLALVAQGPVAKRAGEWVLRAAQAKRAATPGQVAFITVYPEALLAAYRPAIEQGLQAMRGTLVTTPGPTDPGAPKPGAAAPSSTSQVAIDAARASLDLLTQCERLELELSGVAGAAELTLAMVPRARTALAAFVKAQAPSDFALLSRVSLTGSAAAGGGQMVLGPASATVWSWMERLLAQTSLAGLVPDMRRLTEQTRGDFAFAMAIPPTGMEMSMLYGVTSPATTSAALDTLAEKMRKGGPRTMEMMGIKSRYELQSDAPGPDGLRLHRMITTYDYSGMPKTAATPPGLRPARSEVAWGVWDDVMGVATTTRVNQLVASSRQKGTVPATFAPFVDAARARKASVLEIFDHGALLPSILRAGIKPTAAPLAFWLAFGAGRGTLGFTVPASSIAAMVSAFSSMQAAPPPTSL